MNNSLPLPESLRQFVNSCRWTFAKTYARTWPHEYIVRDRVAEELFVLLVRHIRTNGYEAKFYRKPITYFDEEEMVYWTMGAPIEETTIVNRCKKEDSYEYRLRNGTLPESKTTRAEQSPPPYPEGRVDASSGSGEA